MTSGVSVSRAADTAAPSAAVSLLCSDSACSAPSRSTRQPPTRSGITCSGEVSGSCGALGPSAVIVSFFLQGGGPGLGGPSGGSGGKKPGPFCGGGKGGGGAP